MNNQKGFTMVELIAVLLLTGILFTIAFTKYDMLGKNATDVVGEQVVQQMTSEALDGWTKAKFSNEGWVDDATCFALENYSSFKFQGGISGGVLTVGGGGEVKIKRSPSTIETPAKWARVN